MLRSGIRIPAMAKDSAAASIAGNNSDRHLAVFLRNQGLTSEEISRTLRISRTGGKLWAS